MGTPHPETPTGHETTFPGSKKPENKTIYAEFNFLSIFDVKKGPGSLENRFMSSFIEQIFEKMIFF